MSDEMLMQMPMQMQLGNGNGHGDGDGDADGGEGGWRRLRGLIRFVPKWPFGKSVLITSQKKGENKNYFNWKAVRTKGKEENCLHLSNRSRPKKGFSTDRLWRTRAWVYTG